MEFARLSESDFQNLNANLNVYKFEFVPHFLGKNDVKVISTGVVAFIFETFQHRWNYLVDSKPLARTTKTSLRNKLTAVSTLTALVSENHTKNMIGLQLMLQKNPPR